MIAAWAPIVIVVGLFVYSMIRGGHRARMFWLSILAAFALFAGVVGLIALADYLSH